MLVDKILEILDNFSRMETQEYVPIKYVRDFLIPPREREGKNHIWQKSIDLLERYENRVSANSYSARTFIPCVISIFFFS